MAAEPGVGDRLWHATTAFLAFFANGHGRHRLCRIGAGPHHPRRRSGAATRVLPTVIWRWPGVYHSGSHATGAQLWPEMGVHHATLPAVERHGGASDPDAGEAMRAPASFREPVAHYTGDC